MSENPEKKGQNFEIKVEISKEVAEGIYSNLVVINHSHSEFILDFTKLLPGVDSANVKSRIIMTPSHTKSLLAALKDNIEKYEKSFGSITSNRSNGGFMSSGLHFN